MKKFIKHSLSFGLILLIGYPILVFIFGSILPVPIRKNIPFGSVSGFLFHRLQDLETYGSADITVLGSSHAYRGFDPRLFSQKGLKIFNLGSSAQTPSHTDILINRHLHKLKPKLVIFETYPAVFQNKGIQPTVDLLSNDKIDFQLAQLAIQTKDIRVINTLIYGVLRQSFGISRSEKTKTSRDTYIPGGYIERAPSKLTSVPEYGTRTWKFDSLQVQAFEQILTDFKKRDIPYLLVQAPMNQNAYNSYTNNEEIDSYFRSWDDNYLNYNILAEFPNDLFFNETHLNQDGVVKFNQLLIEELRLRNLVLH